MELPSARLGGHLKRSAPQRLPATTPCTERQGCRVTITPFYSLLLYFSFFLLLLPNWHKTPPVFVFVYSKPIESGRQQFKISSLLSFFIPKPTTNGVDINGQCHATWWGIRPRNSPHSLKQVSNCNTTNNNIKGELSLTFTTITTTTTTTTTMLVSWTVWSNLTMEPQSCQDCPHSRWYKQ